MAAVKTKKKFERSERKAAVARLRLQGYTQTAIAVQMGVTQGAISQLCKTIEKEWAEQAAGDVLAMKIQAEARISILETKYWEAYDRSCAPKQTKKMRKTTIGKKKKSEAESDEDEESGTNERSEQSMGEITQVGDPRFLDGIARCNRDRIELFGLAAAQKIDLNDVSERQTSDLTARLGKIIAVGIARGSAQAGSNEAFEDGADGVGDDRSGAGAPSSDRGTSDEAEEPGEDIT